MPLTPTADHLIELEETDDGIWSVFFDTALLSKFDERGRILHDGSVSTSLLQ